MNKYQIIIGVVGLSLYWFLIKLMINHKVTREKPEAEQKKFKTHAYFSFLAVLVIYVGSQLLINSKTTAWIPWLGVGIYITVWCVGGYFIWLAYRLGIKQEVALVRRSDGKQFNTPHKFIKSIAIINLLIGLSLWLLGIAIIIFKINFVGWAPFIVVIAYQKKIVLSKLEKNDVTLT